VIESRDTDPGRFDSAPQTTPKSACLNHGSSAALLQLRSTSVGYLRLSIKFATPIAALQGPATSDHTARSLGCLLLNGKAERGRSTRERGWVASRHPKLDLMERVHTLYSV